MDDPSPSFDERVLDAAKEGRVGIEIRKSYGLQF